VRPGLHWTLRPTAGGSRLGVPRGPPARRIRVANRLYCAYGRRGIVRPHLSGATYGHHTRWRGPLRFLEAGHPGRAHALLQVLLPRSSTVEVAASPPAVHLGPELALQLHQAPDPGAVGAEVGLDLGSQLADGGQVDAEQLRTAPVPAPEPPNRENRQQFLGLLFARLPLGTVGGWVGRSWRSGPRRVPRCDPGGTAALGATWGGGAYRTPCPWWRGSGSTAEPGPRSRSGPFKDACSGLRAGSGARQR
jgi:hypothetical protein